MRQFIASIILIFSLSTTSPAHAIGELIGGDLNFKGTVVAQGCSIVPSSQSVAVDFGEISTRTLYMQGKSQLKSFVIELQDCSTAVFNTVSVTFNGQENVNMIDRLAITPVASSTVSGIGIGFEESDGTPISLESPTTAVALSESTMQLSFNAFVEGEQDALNNKTLQAGAFQATAYYTLNYQ